MRRRTTSFLRQERSTQRRMAELTAAAEQARTQLEREHAQLEQARAAQARAHAQAEAALQREAAALAEIERLKSLLTNRPDQ